VKKEEIIDNINLEILTQVRKFQWRAFWDMVTESIRGDIPNYGYLVSLV